MMTLDEAIKHCEEKSCGNSECVMEHQQLNKWLKELKVLKEEPVCEDLDAAADKYESEQQEKYKDRDNHDFDNYRDGFVDGLTYTYDAFKAGAQWQKNQTIGKAWNG